MSGLLQRLVSLLGFPCVMRMPPELEPKPKPQRSPVPGEKWRLYNGGDPFPPKSLVTVLDVKDGWVRYKIGSGEMFGDERMKVSTFSEVYRPHEVPIPAAPVYRPPETRQSLRASGLMG